MAIERANFPHDTWSAESFWNELAGDNAAYFVAEQDSRVVGYAGVTYIEPDAHIQSVSVAAEAHGQGIAAQLVQQLIDFADQSGAQRCLLEVRLDNIAARKLYAKFGFEELGIRKGYYPGNEDALVLARPSSAKEGRE